jgi:nitroreductase
VVYDSATALWDRDKRNRRNPVDNVRNLIRNRRSCRFYTEETLQKDMLVELIDDAVWVPSGSNNQPWRFVVIVDRELMKKYSDAAKSDWLRRLDNTPHMQQYEAYLKDPDYNIFYNAPALIILYGNTESHWYNYDCSMVAYNLQLLAEEAGLGACWIGLAHNTFSAEETKAEFGIPKEYELVAPIIMGYPGVSGTASVVPRKPFVMQIISAIEMGS